MTYKEEGNCPICDKGKIKFITIRGIYSVDEGGCSVCKATTSAIEKVLNGKRTKLYSVEKRFLYKER